MDRPSLSPKPSLSHNPGLSHRPRLSRKACFRRASFFMAILFALFAIVFAGFGAYLSRNAALLAAEGVDTQGVVVAREMTTSRRSSGGTRENYDLTIDYPGPDGTILRVERGVSEAIFRRHNTGSPIALRYALSDPDVVEIEGGDTRGGSYMALGIGGLFGLIALISALVLARGLAAMRRAAREGERRLAVVSDHKSVGKSSAQTSTFGWQAGGEAGRSGAMRNKDLPPLGAQVALYVDPRSGKAFWEGEY